jgi:hypothetical protein
MTDDKVAEGAGFHPDATPDLPPTREPESHTGTVPVWRLDDTGTCRCPAGARCDSPGRHEAPATADALSVRPGLALGAANGLLALGVDTGTSAELLRARLGLHGTVATLDVDGDTLWLFRTPEGETVAPRAVSLTRPVTVYGDGTVLPLSDDPLALSAVGELPDTLRLALMTTGVLSASVAVHRDEAWRALPGAPIVDDTPRTYTLRGDVRRLVDEWGDRLTYTPGLGWRVWTESGWSGVDHSEALLARMIADLAAVHRREARMLRKVTLDAEAKRAAGWSEKAADRAGRRLLGELLSDPRILVPRDGLWDTDGHLCGLPVRDGVRLALDLRTGDVVDARDLLISRHLGAHYDGRGFDHWRERSVYFVKYLADLTHAYGADWVRLLQRAAGRSLFGSWRGRDSDDVFNLSGPTRCGKSTFVETVHSAAGDYGRALNSNLLFGSRGNPEFVVAEFRGVRFGHLSEPETHASLNVELLKRISGGDAQTGRRPYGRSEISFHPEASVWIVSNHPLQHSDDALWERLRPFRFDSRTDYSGARADDRMRSALSGTNPDPTELSAALAWMVEGARQWAAEGWGDTSVWDETRAEMKAEHDPLARFMAASVAVTLDPAHTVTAAQMAGQVRTWSLLEDERLPMTGTVLLEELVHRVTRAGADYVRRSRTFVGVQLVTSVGSFR